MSSLKRMLMEAHLLLVFKHIYFDVKIIIFLTYFIVQEPLFPLTEREEVAAPFPTTIPSAESPEK